MSMRSVVRGWVRQPAWTCSVLACLAFGIAGAGTVMTFAYSLLARPLPYPEPDRLVLLVPAEPGPGDRPYVSYPNFVDLRERLASFERLDGAMVSRLVVETPLGSERLRGEAIGPRYLDLVGVAPALGRSFTAEEYEGRGEPVVLLSHRVWVSHFAADPAVLGQALRTRAGLRTVVGVMPDGYPGIAEGEGTDVWLPERQSNHPALLENRAEKSTMAFGRLKAGVTLDAAAAELLQAQAVLQSEHAEANRALSLRVQPIAELWRERFRGVLRWLSVSAVFLLAIAAGNVSLLMLVRALATRSEFALRRALGAASERLWRDQWRQSATLATFGGVLGVLLAYPLVRAFAALGQWAIPIHLRVQFDALPVVACAVAVCLVAAVVGLIPAFALRADVAASGRGARGVLGATHGRRLRGLLVAAQCALSFAVLVGAALFGQSYQGLRHIDFGYRTDQLLRYQVSLQADRQGDPVALQAFWNDLSRQFDAIPGVRGHGYMAPTLPPYDAEATTAAIAGTTPTGGGDGLPTNLRYATPEAFAVLGVGIRAGRGFEPTDRAGSRPVALVSEGFAARLGGNVLDRTIRLATAQPVEATIVGVVANARWNGQRDRNPNGNDVFLSLAQFPRASVGVVFDVAGDPSAAVAPVREQVLRLEPAAALHWIDTMDQALDGQTAPERFFAMLGWTFGGTALLLSLFGLYGVVSHYVASRRRELGLRLALGSTPRRVHALVQSQALVPAGIGVVVGCVLGYALARLVESQLHGVAALDPSSYVLAAIAVLGGAVLAALVPGLRAASTSPGDSLRAD